MLSGARRNPLIDQWKLLLIALVVFGHSLPKSNPVFAAIYTFHMPGFIFLLGATSKPRPSVRGQVEILTLLIVFQLLYAAEMTINGLVLPPYWIFAPLYIMWFFMSTLVWRGSLHLLLATPYPLLIASTTSLFAGLFDSVGVYLSAGRTFAFLPIFIAGHLYGRRLISWAEKPRKVFELALLFVAGVTLAWLWSAYLSRHKLDVLYQADSYHSMHLSVLHGLAFRAISLVLGVMIAMCFFGAFSRPLAIGSLGKNTRSVFLFHGFVALNAEYFLTDYPIGFFATLLVSGVATGVLVLILSQPIVARAIDFIASCGFKTVSRVV